MFKEWIKDYRQELKSDIWAMPPIYHRVWQYLKYSVSTKERNIPMRDGSFITVLPGQMVTSLRNICRDVGWFERGAFKELNAARIKEAIDWMEQQGMIEVGHGKHDKQYTMITLVNWGKYQEEGGCSDEKEEI